MGVPKRLTEMQQRFAELVVFGGPDGPVTQTEAAKIAGYSEKRCRQEGSELLNPKLSPLVVQYVSKLKEERMKKYEVNYENHITELARIKEAALKKGSFSSAVNAETNRGKAAGLYIDRKIIKTGKLEEMSVEQLEAKMKKILEDYSSNNYNNNYKQLTKDEAHNSREEFDFELTEILQFEHVNDLTDHERTFFERGYQCMNRIPQLYGTPKIHKNYTSQVPFRPVNSQVGSLSALASTFVDYYLKKLTPYIPGYVKKSFKVIKRLKNINCSIDSISIATSDAVAMYPNILNNEGITACNKYFALYAKESKSFFPSELITKLLRLIMTCNTFEFGNTYWKQVDGTAMGTPCACNYATIVFAYYKRTQILPTFKKNLLLYV